MLLNVSYVLDGYLDEMSICGVDSTHFIFGMVKILPVSFTEPKMKCVGYA